MNQRELVQRFLLYALILFFVAAGVAHFLIPNFYLRMMPPYVPAPLFMVYVSGLLEIVFGIFLLTDKLIFVARYGLIVLLLAVFPANVHMALNPELFLEFTPQGLWLRLPLQLLFVVWVWIATSSCGMKERF